MTFKDYDVSICYMKNELVLYSPAPEQVSFDIKVMHKQSNYKVKQKAIDL